MPRKKRVVDYAPELPPLPNEQLAEIRDKLGDRLGDQTYAKIKQPLRNTRQLINDISAAFRALKRGPNIDEKTARHGMVCPRPLKPTEVEQPMARHVTYKGRVFKIGTPEPVPAPPRREREAAIESAIHDLTAGLSRATAHPPSWFRLKGRPMTAKKGRPKAIEATFIALVCRWHYEQITGKPATASEDGPFVGLLEAVFRAFNMLADPINRADPLNRADPINRAREVVNPQRPRKKRPGAERCISTKEI
jgi:hypothetical protein